VKAQQKLERHSVRRIPRPRLLT